MPKDTMCPDWDIFEKLLAASFYKVVQIIGDFLGNFEISPFFSQQLM